MTLDHITPAGLTTIALLLIAGAAVVAAMFLILRSANAAGHDRHEYAYTAIAVVALAAITVAGKPTVTLPAADRLLATPAPTRITVDLADCPPPQPGLTDQVVFFISSQADHQPEVHGCTRIAERSFGASTRSAR